MHEIEYEKCMIAEDRTLIPHDIELEKARRKVIAGLIKI